MPLGPSAHNAQPARRRHAVERWVFVKLAFPGAIPVDVVPCRRIVEGQLVRGNAHDVPVLGMNFANLKGYFSGQQLPAVPDSRCARLEGTGEMPQWVEVEIVYHPSQRVSDQLGRSALPRRPSTKYSVLTRLARVLA